MSRTCPNLQLNVEEVKNELSLVGPTETQTDRADPELDKKAEQYVEMLIGIDPEDVDAQNDAKSAVEEMGRVLQQDAAHRSQMLQRPIKELSEHGEDGSPVANALIELKMQVEELDPNKFDFEAGWLSRLLGKLPGVGTPLKRYFTKFESAQTVLDAIDNSLKKGREQLARDNVTLSEDQKVMRELTHKLERQITMGELLDQKLQYKVDRDIPATDSRHEFVKTELLFPLRQRVMDLQQQQVVNQQGVLATEIIQRNNKELMRGVDRARNVTMSALTVAVTVAAALENQRIVLDKITALNETTSNLIAGTASTLKTQGAAIHTQASSAMLDMDALKSAFTDINAAMDEISRYRQEALPKMAQTIVEFDELTAAGEKAVRRMEQGNRAAGQITLEVD